MNWGVTGRYAAGKDEVTKLLCERGYAEVNVDRLGHRALEEKRTEAVRLFGEGILAGDGTIDRRRLSRIVFRDRKRLSRLEALLHPRMRELAAEAVRSARTGAVVNAALLFPMGLDELVQAVIVVRAPLFQRLARARSRDRLGWAELLRRFSRQREILPQQPGRKVDIYDITNSRDKAYLREQVDRCVREHERGRRKEGHV